MEVFTDGVRETVKERVDVDVTAAFEDFLDAKNNNEYED